MSGQVTVSPIFQCFSKYLEFDLDCETTADYCIYKINAPQVDPNTYKQDDAQYRTDKSDFEKASSAAYYDNSHFLASDVYQSFENVKEQVQNLTA